MNVQLLGSLAYLAALVLADSFLLFGPPAMGIEGAGFGASIAQWVGAATVCGLLSRKQVRSAPLAVAYHGWLDGWPRSRYASAHQACLRRRCLVRTARGSPPACVQIFDWRDMATLPSPSDARPYARMTGNLAVNNLSALLPTLVATSVATGLGVSHLGAHTILRQLMGFWLQVGGGGGG